MVAGNLAQSQVRLFASADPDINTTHKTPSSEKNISTSERSDSRYKGKVEPKFLDQV